MNENEDPNGPYEGTSVQDTAGPPEGTAPKGRGPLKGLFSTLRKGYNGMKDDMVADDDDRSEISIKRRRFTIILLVGIFICAVMFMISIAISSGGIIPITDAFSALVSAIQKGGHDLDTTELYIFQSRLPRTIAAIGVGAGLAIAGCMFQALIRNPLVDPYITGVSSGAGCFAIAIVVMGITLSALSDFSNYIIPVAAIAGGLFAFGITLAVAEGAGGSATNYILAGTIVGFAFTSVQTIFLSLQKDNLTNVMWWLYGSFANITWENAFLVLIPALAISFISMLWAREFNLFMSGEDQARQLGLNVRMFKAEMMVVASILTSVCVAFVGVIGFVGLVIPHACRMLMGGDHRLIMPASIVLGACLMLFADLVARTVIAPLEIPVGAVTALIGTPVFAYMLIRRGRDYDG